MNLVASLPLIGWSQDWNTGGNASLSPTNSFLGTTDGVPVNFRTSNVLRSTLYNGTSATINSFTGINQAGFWGIGRNAYTFGSVGPYSRVHIGDYNAPNWQGGYRDYMFSGLTLTANSDHAYIGLRDEGGSNDISTLLFYWSDSLANSSYPNVASFVYGEAYSSGASAGSPTHYSGREIMRLHPTGYVGLGDWRTAGLQPQQRLDLLDGKVRIRQLPSDAASSSTEVMVVESDGVVGHRPAYALDCKWVMGFGTGVANDLSTAYSSADANCPDAYENVGIGVQANSSSGTAQGVNLYVLDNTPSSSSAVNNAAIRGKVEGRDISKNVAIEAFAVPLTGYTAGENTAVYAETKDGTTGNTAVFALAEVSSTVTAQENWAIKAQAKNNGGTVVGENIALYAVSQFANQSIGGRFEVESGGELNKGVDIIVTPDEYCDECDSYGVYALVNATDATNSTTNNNIAVYAEARGNAESDWNVGVYATANGANGGVGGTGHNDWAFWSQGDSYANNGTWQGSDAMFKTNVEPIPDPLERLLSLNPKQYFMDTVGYPFMAFSSQQQFGLIADSMQAVVPQLVREVTRPAQYDTLGNIVAPELTFKAVKYEGLTPLLIGALQEQNMVVVQMQTQLSAMQAQMAAMQVQLTACCAGAPPDDGSGMMTPQGQGGGTDMMLGTEERHSLADQLRIQPNPFTTSTSISYTLQAPGQVRLLVSTSAGKQLRVLEEAQRAEGTYTYVWNTSDLASGVYNVMLLVDGAPMVQKVVKIER